MKRLLSFGFIPVSQSSQGSVEKRAKHSDSGTDPPQPSEDQPEPLQSPEPLQVPSKFVRNDVGTYSSDRLRRLSDEDRLWLFAMLFNLIVLLNIQQRKSMARNVPFSR